MQSRFHKAGFFSMKALSVAAIRFRSALGVKRFQRSIQTIVRTNYHHSA